MNLIYIKQSDGNEKIIPYQGTGATTLVDINEKSGSVYSVARFISDMESAYDEYTEKKLAQIQEENEMGEGGIGGALLPKKMHSGARKENGDSVANYLMIVICSLFVVFVGMSFVVIQKKRGKNHA